jgi:hypothetical protein
MCEPTTLVALGVSAQAASAAAAAGTMASVMAAASAVAPVIGVGSAVAGFAAQKQQADSQEAAMRQNYDIQQNQMQLQRNQNDQQASEKMSAVALEAMRETGRLSASGFLGGNSLIRAQNEIQMNTGTDIATLEANRLAVHNQNTTEGMAAASRTNSQMNSIKQPSLIGTGLQIAGGLADAETRKQNNRVPTAKPY